MEKKRKKNETKKKLFVLCTHRIMSECVRVTVEIEVELRCLVGRITDKDVQKKGKKRQTK